MWPNSLVFAPLLIWYIYLFRLSWVKSFWWLGGTVVFYHFWEASSLFVTEKIGLSPFLSCCRSWLQERLVRIVESRYSGETGVAVNYLLFNKKGVELKPFLTQLNQLSVTHLLVVSGMHLNILKKIIEKLGSRLPSKKLSRALVLVVLGTYSWATAFSVPSCRVFLEESGSEILKDRKTTPLIKWAKASWCSFLLFPHSINSLGFFLSYSISLLFRLIDKLELLKLKNWVLKMSIAALIATFTFSYKTRKLFPLSILNQLFLTPIITLVFIFFLVSWHFPFLSSIGIKVYEWFSSFIFTLGLNGAYIEREKGSYLEPLYFSAILACLGLMISKLYLSSGEEYRYSKGVQLNSRFA
ncbi:ComEC/Rec2 family competence protein [Candidatus Mycoplasma haematominutum]|nr:ComEC/Rec2 family competence protein [Candidatus Mycoplasma haematominutum]